MSSKYKFMEANLLKNKDLLKRRIPETEKDIAMIQHLIHQHEQGEALNTHFSLADNVFAKASVDTSVQKVCIWLGANVMVEYSYDEAMALLQTNLKTAKERLAEVSSDLSFLRDNIITTEVNIARIFNYDVRKRREERDEKLAAELEAK